MIHLLASPFRWFIALSVGLFLGTLVLALARDDEPKSLNDLKGAVRSACWSSDGATILTAGSPDHRIRVWNTAGQRVRSFSDPGSTILALTTDPERNGVLGVSGGTDGFLRLWRSADRPEQQLTDNLANPAQLLLPSPDGTSLLVAAGPTVSYLDLSGTSKRKDLPDTHAKDDVTALAWLPRSGSQPPRFAAGDKGGVIRVWGKNDADMSKPLLIETPAPLLDLAVDDRGRLYSVGKDGLIRSWKIPKDLARRGGEVPKLPVPTAVSANGRYIADLTASKRKIRIWDVENTNEMPIELPKDDEAGDIGLIALSQDGELVTYTAPGAGGKQQVKLGVRASSAADAIPSALFDNLTTLALYATKDDPQGDRFIATAGKNQAIHLHTILAGKKISEATFKDLQKPPPGDVDRLLFTPDGKKLIASYSKAIGVLDTADMTDPVKIDLVDQALQHLALSPDGNWLAFATGSTLQVRDMKKPTEQRASIGLMNLTGLAVGVERIEDKDIPVVATGSQDAKMRLWVLEGNELREREQFKTDSPPRPLTLTTKDPLQILSAVGNKLWSWSPLRVTASPVANNKKEIVRAKFDKPLKPGKLAVVPRDQDKDVEIYSLSSRDASLAVAHHTGSVDRLLFHPTESLLFTVSSKDASFLLSSYSLQAGGTLDPLKTRTFMDKVLALAASGKSILVGLDHAKPVALLNLDTLEDSETFQPLGLGGKGQVGTLAVFDDPNSTSKVVAGQGKSLQVYRLENKFDPLFTVRGHDGQIYSIAWLPSPPRRFLTGGADGRVRLWKVSEKDELTKLDESQAYSAIVFAIACPPHTISGINFATGGNDGQVRLWEIKEDKLIVNEKVRIEHRGAVYSVAIHPNPDLLVSGSADGTVRFWKLPEGQPLSWKSDGKDVSQLDHKDSVCALNFLDQKTLVTLDYAGNLKAWSVDLSGQPIKVNPMGDAISLGKKTYGAYYGSGDSKGTLLFFTDEGAGTRKFP